MNNTAFEDEGYHIDAGQSCGCKGYRGMTIVDIQSNQQSTSNSSPANQESIQMVSEILKRTNQLIQKGELDKAQGELIKANRVAKEQYKNSLLRAIQDKIVTPQTPLTPLPLTPLQAIMTTISSPKQKEKTPVQETAKTPATKIQDPTREPAKQTDDRSMEFSCYREELAKAWIDGVLTKDEERHLLELRTVLEISDSEHKALEKEIQHACFNEALSKHISNNPNAHSDEKLIAELKSIFNISPDEHAQIQNLVVQQKEVAKRDKILIVDDDVQFLNLLSSSMKENGFEITAVTTSDDAYKYLQECIPDLILCDINLPNSSMNGFVFCEKIQANRNLQNIPFVFLTGLTDERFANTGKALGADDYLMKPIAMQSLLSTLHGRLKRFRQLRGFSTETLPTY